MQNLHYVIDLNAVYGSSESQEVSKKEFSDLIVYARKHFGYCPSPQCDEYAPFALQKRAFFHWLLRRNSVPLFRMASDIYLYPDDGFAFCIDLKPVCGCLKTL